MVYYKIGDIVRQTKQNGKYPFSDLADKDLEVMEVLNGRPYPIRAKLVGTHSSYSATLFALDEIFLVPQKIEEPKVTPTKFQVGDKVSSIKYPIWKNMTVYKVWAGDKYAYTCVDSFKGRGAFDENDLVLVEAVSSPVETPTAQEPANATKDNSLVESFTKFDTENPYVYTLFKSYAFRAMNRGHTTISPKTIVERIRWDIPDFKISNNHISYYARKFVDNYPQHESFFLFKKAA